LDILKLSLTELSENIKSKKISSLEACEFYLNRIKSHDTKLNAFLKINEKAIEQAKAKDQEKEKKGRLFGVPIAVKDNFCTKGLTTTAGSKILENFVPPYTAHCIELLENEGAIILGKTNLDEFAMGSSSENSAFSLCKNPWNIERVPGGSSGGSASAMAAQLAPLTIGSDTGGSIRQPANFCGVVGVKPTYGSISRFGMVAFASSLDQAGPLSKNVTDAALALDIMIRKDPKDSTNVKRQQACLTNLKTIELKGLKIGLPREYFSANLDEGTQKEIEKVKSELSKKGCEFVEISLATSQHAISVYYLIAASEASSNLARYDGVRYGLRDIEDVDGREIQDLDGFYKRTRSRGFGEEVKRRILLGTFALSSGYFDAYYTKACQVRRLMSQDFMEAFTRCDFILAPVTTTTAFKIGEKINDPISMYFNDIFTTPANLTGLPAMSLPIGLDKNKMPVGLQIISPAFTEEAMLNFAYTIEKLVSFNGEIHGY
jgi:aspartyl-tRNA(Asn)/glutamyl-tRNA(Gln) amidotransferase subunit A